MIVYNRRINMVPGEVPVYIHMSQYDTDVVLQFELYASEGTFVVEQGTTALIRGTKPDRNGISLDAEIETEGGVTTVTVEVIQQMTAVAGKSLYELSLRYDGEELNTANFILDIERAPLDADTVPSESVIREIDKAVEKYMDEHDIVIDDTLTQQGKAADAKKTGDEISSISERVGEGETTYEYINIPFELADYTNTERGITRTQNSGGTVEATGTSTASVSFALRDSNGYVALSLEAGTYRISGCPSGGSINTYGFDVRTTVVGSILSADYGSGREFTLTEPTVLYPHIRIANGDTVNLVFTPKIEQKIEVSGGFLTAKDVVAREDASNTVMDGDIINAMLDCARTYIAKDSTVQYGQKTAIHWYENGVNYTKDRLFDHKDQYTPTEIDCSSLALLVLGGVPYEGSKYVGDENYFGMCGYCFDIFHGDETERPSGGSQTLTHNMAKWFEDNGMGFEPAEDGSDLLPGDLLFFSYPDRIGTYYRGIGHCEIFCNHESNFPINYKSPVLITIGSDNNANSSVQCYARDASFWDGSDSSGRKLAYVGRIPLKKVKNRNQTIYADPDTNQCQYSFSVNQYTPVTIEFDGTLNVTSAYFELQANGTKVAETFRITSGLVGIKKRYKIIIPSSNANMTSIAIVAKNDSTAKINDLRIANGFNF